MENKHSQPYHCNFKSPSQKKKKKKKKAQIFFKECLHKHDLKGLELCAKQP